MAGSFHKDRPASAGDLRITAIVPVYNRFEHVPRTLDSILRQTYSPDEIILVDDASAASLEDFLRPLG